MAAINPYADHLPEASLNMRMVWGGGALLLHGLLIAAVGGLSHKSAQIPALMSVALYSASAASSPPSVPAPQPVVKHKVMPTHQQATATATNSPSAISQPQAPSTSSHSANASGTASGETRSGTDNAVSAPRFDAAYLNNPAPAYPIMSKRLGEQGKVMLRVHVLPTGTADRVDIHKSSGSTRLDAAAQEAVQRWRFVPAKQAGGAIAEWVLVPVSFNLKEK